MIELAVAVLAGVLTVAAPCLLPTLPVLLGVSIGDTNRARPIVSFAAVALLFGALADTVSQGTRR